MSSAQDQKKASNAKTGDDEIIIIKKYANRRLYNTATSSYVTLDYLAEMIRAGEQFVVFDAKSGQDLTRSVLTQIIFEEESKGHNLLPIRFLRDLIGYYGDNMQSFVPSYLEMSMDSFRKNSENMRRSLSGAVASNPGLKVMEDMARQNMAVFERSMSMFGMGDTVRAINPWQDGGQDGKQSEGTDPSEELRRENEALRRELEELKKATRK